MLDGIVAIFTELLVDFTQVYRSTNLSLSGMQSLSDPTEDSHVVTLYESSSLGLG